MRTLILPVYLLFYLMLWAVAGNAQTSTLPAPGFHHLHLNSVDPEAAIDFYTRQFPSTAKEVSSRKRRSSRYSTETGR